MAEGRFNASIVSQGSQILDEMNLSSAALVQAVLLSDDGFEVTRTPRIGESDGRFASMASSVQALSEAVIHELRIGSGDVMIIQASAGVVIQSRVGAQPIVLSALFRTDESLGKCLVLVRNATSMLDAGFRNGTLTVAAPAV